MKRQNQSDRPLANRPALKESRTSRFNLPIRHPALRRFVVDQILSSPMRLHRYRALSARMIEDAMNENDRGKCQ